MKPLTVSEVARLAGVTVRTLHHYDAIGLLCPVGRSQAGYRLYDHRDLERLRDIVVLRELGFSLEAIGAVVDDASVSREDALRSQRALLLERAAKSHAMINAIDAALAANHGETTMNPKEMFAGFDPSAHQQEAEQRWGDTDAYRESVRRTKRYGPKEFLAIREEGDAIVKQMGEARDAGAPADGPRAMGVAERHRLHIDRWFYPCSKTMHAGLAEMYIADDRFAAHFNAHGEGLADFFAEAVCANSAA